MARSLTGRTAAQEARWQRAEQDKQSARVEGRLFRELRKTFVKYGGAYDNPLQQEQTMEAHRASIQKILAQEYAQAWETFGRRAIEAAGQKHAGRFEVKEAESLFVSLARAWVMARVAEKVTAIVNTTRKQAESIIRRVTDTAIQEGLGQEALARLMRKTFAEQGSGLSRARASVIARTETHNAANSAAHEAIRSTGLPIRKEWVTATDGREREAHSLADGQIVDINSPFLVDGEEMMYPGDQAGSAANVINCRCAVAHIVDD